MTARFTPAGEAPVERLSGRGNVDWSVGEGDSLRFHLGVRLLVGGGDEGSDASDGFVQIGVDDAARGFLDFAHGSGGAFLWQAPKAD